MKASAAKVADRYLRAAPHDHWVFLRRAMPWVRNPLFVPVPFNALSAIELRGITRAVTGRPIRLYRELHLALRESDTLVVVERAMMRRLRRKGLGFEMAGWEIPPDLVQGVVTEVGGIDPYRWSFPVITRDGQGGWVSSRYGEQSQMVPLVEMHLPPAAEPILPPEVTDEVRRVLTDFANGGNLLQESGREGWQVLEDLIWPSLKDLPDPVPLGYAGAEGIQVYEVPVVDIVWAEGHSVIVRNRSYV